MTTQPQWFMRTMALVGAVLLAASARAETLLEDFDNGFFFDAMYASWAPLEPLIGGPTNWTITATNYGSASTLFYMDDQITPTNRNASADQYVELEVTVAVGPGDFAGPILQLEDADGTRVAWAWYGLGSGYHKLTSLLSTPTYTAAAGTVPGLDLANLVRFNIEVDPGFGPTKVYTLTLMNLRTYPTPPPACVTLLSDFNNTSVDGGYSSWATNLPPSQPNNWTITRTSFGGGFKNIIPDANAVGETTVELQVTVTNTIDETGVTVVLQDGDGTQETWSWYGLTNGSYVLTKSLYAGTPVGAQPGSIPGLNVANLDWFHIQCDPGAFTNNAHTVIFENLEINGFNPQITKSTFNPATSQFNLVWNSRPARQYGLAYVSDLSGSFGVVSNNITSGGTSTTNTVTVPVGSKGFIKVFEQCQ